MLDIQLADSHLIKEVTETFILGLQVQSKGDSITSFIFKKAASKLWLLRRLKKYNFDDETLVDFYTKEIRVLLEYAVPVWYIAITKKQSNSIEKYKIIQLQSF